jgi:hypothetical protein
MITKQRFNSRKVFRRLKDRTGVYFLFDSNKKLIYIGYASCLFTRLSKHLSGTSGINFKENDIYFLSYRFCNSIDESYKLESFLHSKFNAKFNYNNKLYNLRKKSNIKYNKIVNKINIDVMYNDILKNILKRQLIEKILDRENIFYHDVYIFDRFPEDFDQIFFNDRINILNCRIDQSKEKIRGYKKELRKINNTKYLDKLKKELHDKLKKEMGEFVEKNKIISTNLDPAQSPIDQIPHKTD